MVPGQSPVLQSGPGSLKLLPFSNSSLHLLHREQVPDALLEVL